jgi:hypothetical protein
VERRPLITVQNPPVPFDRRVWLEGKVAQERVEQELAWVHQEGAHLAVYERVLSQAKARKRTEA